MFRDLLIKVTSFFRDADAFETLGWTVVPKLCEGRGADDTIGIWMPGCSTGKEVYSIAILMRKHMDTLGAVPKAVAVTKAAAVAWTSSAAMLSEAIHSVVDSGNRVVPLSGLSHAARPAMTGTRRAWHEVYFWVFVASGDHVHLPWATPSASSPEPEDGQSLGAARRATLREPERFPSHC